MLDSADDSPVQGLKLASIGDDTTYLLYAGRWFPVNAYGINRFTATMNITVPAHMIVIGSGKEGAGTCSGDKAASRRAAHQDLRFHLGQAQFSGHDRGRDFSGIQERRSRPRPARLLQAAASESGSELTRNRGQGIYLLHHSLRRRASTTLKVVEIPDDTVPSAWAPEIAAIASRAVTEKVELPAAGEHDRAPVVGRFGEPGFAR